MEGKEELAEMPIERKYKESDVARALADAVEGQKRAAARWLCYVGEAAVAEARTNGSYTDRTGNLRSSVGYAVSMDGRVVQAAGFKDGDGGAGRAFALRCVREYPLGAALVVVAGMEYAAYVSARGYNVLESAELLARRMVRELAAKLG